MFRAGNPFEELVVKATDENLTSEDWDTNLRVCDKLASNREADARQCLAAVQKRVAHRNANVQLFALTLTDMLSKNGGSAVHHEIASRAFTQTLAKVVRDKATHAVVKTRILQLLREWANEYKNDDTLGLVEDTVRDLKQEYFDADDDDVSAAPPQRTAEWQRREEEELERVLKLSLEDQGGAVAAPHTDGSAQAAPPAQLAPPAPSAPSASYAPGPSSLMPGSSPYAMPNLPSAANMYIPTPPAAAAASPHAGTTVPARSASSAHAAPSAPSAYATPSAPSAYGTPGPSGAYAAPSAPNAPSAEGAASAPSASTPSMSTASPAPARPAFVRALYDFEPDEPGELRLFRGDVVRILDTVYEQWWRGEVRHEVGIFPVNYVEPIAHDPAAEALEEEEERDVLTQASDIHLLHARLLKLGPDDDLVADDELQELYQRALVLRPKLVKLLDAYEAKVHDLKALNDKFVEARSALERWIEQANPAATTPTAPSAPDLGPRPNEEEKMRLYEQARRDVEAYHHGMVPTLDVSTDAAAAPSSSRDAAGVAPST